MGLVGACSLHSLDRLDSCRRAPDASECQGGSSSSGTSATSGSEQGGGSAGSGAGGSGSGNGSGTDSGGTPSAAGVAGSETGEAGAAGATPLPRTVVALYADYSEGDDKNPQESTQVRAAFDLVNESPDDVPMSELTLRYYYTLEDASLQELDCDYPREGQEAWKCEAVQFEFGTLTGMEAKHYVAISFTPSEDWTLASLGGHSGVFKLRFRKANFSVQNLNNDWSFAESDSIEPVNEQPHVTLYRNGELVYGVEPR